MSSTTTQTVKGACGIAPESQAGVVTGVHPVDHRSKAHAVMAKVAALWEPGSTITYSFFGGTKNQHDAVNRVAPEWTWYAKLNLQRQDDDDVHALVRIAFDPNGGSWSSVGKGALNVKSGGITMNLGWIEDSPVVSDNDRGTILHEWGHALGLMHEHQSPARGGSITLKTSEVFEYYRTTQGWDDALIQSQIINVYNEDDVSNYSKLDTHSVMMYFMPGRLNVEDINVNINNRLSDMDKAYMVINYPRTVQHAKALDWTLEKALDVAGVPATEQKDILSCRDNVSSLRAYFAAWNKETRAKEYEAPASNVSVQSVLSQPNSTTSDDEVTRLMKELLGQHSVRPSGLSSITSEEPTRIEHGIWSGLIGVLKQPIFQHIISSVVNGVLAQNGLNPGTFASQTPSGASYMPNPFAAAGPYDPYATQQGLWSGIADVFSNPAVKTVLSTAVDLAFDVHKPTDSSDDIQHSIFSNISAVLGHPAVRQVLSSLVDLALTQRGLHPATTAQYPAIQQGVWSGLVGVLKHPLFQQVVSGVVGGILTQRAINPNSAPAPASTQHGIFTDVGKLLSHPLVSTVLSSLVNAALAQRGLNPDITASTRPEVQHGIWSGIVKVLKHPAFQRAVIRVITSTLTQHGLKPASDTNAASAPPQYPDDVQQGIWSGIIGVIKHPLFQNIIGSVVDSVLTQNAPNPVGLLSSGGLPAPDTLSQQLNHPLVQQTLTEAVNTALVQRGISPQSQDPFAAQHGIISGIISVIKHPLFHQIIGSVIDAALTQRSINPLAPRPSVQYSINNTIGVTLAQYPQHGLVSGIGSILKHPLFQQFLGSLIEGALSQHALNPAASYVGTPAPAANDSQRGLYPNYAAVPGTPLMNSPYYNTSIALPSIVADQLNSLTPLGLGYGGKSPIIPSVSIASDVGAAVNNSDYVAGLGLDHGGKPGIGPASGVKSVNGGLPNTPPGSDVYISQEA